MARTKATAAAKISSGKSTKARCSAPPPVSSAVAGGSSERTRSSGGGNSVCPRETPKWQKPITNFFNNGGKEQSKHPPQSQDDAGDEIAGSSKPKMKKNIIYSDEELSPEKPKNTELDETLELEELTGENSHKILDYYSKTNKGKGVGKTTNGKENVAINGNDENSNNESDLDCRHNSDNDVIGKQGEEIQDSRSGKREREDAIEEGRSSKRVKV